MVWIVVVLAVGVLGLIGLGWYVVRLYRKVGTLLDELAGLAGQADQVLELLSRIEIPDRLGNRYDATFAAPDDDEGGGDSSSGHLPARPT